MKWVGKSFKVRDVQLSGGYRWFTLGGHYANVYVGCE